MTTEAPAVPFRFFDVQVTRTRRLSPSMMRVTLSGADGEDLGDFVNGGRDQRFKLFFPHPGQDLPVVPRSSSDWFGEWRDMDPSVRGIMRTYTVRTARPGEFDVDFVLHGEGTPSAGPAGHWAATAKPGDRIVALGPTLVENGGFEFNPPTGTSSVVIVGDETSLPAIGAILEWLPGGTPTKVWISVPTPGDRQDLRTEANADITWLSPGELLNAVRGAEFPDAPYFWIAGEAGTIRAIRRHLVNERGYDRKVVEFMGYWRRGADEEQLLAETLAGQDPHTSED